MKTKLLYLATILLVFITSCSNEEHFSEPQTKNKELIVKQIYVELSKIIENSPSFSKIMEEVSTKSSSQWTIEEINKIEEDFLDEQSEEFIELYADLLALNLSPEELTEIVLAYKATLQNDKIYNDGVKEYSESGCSSIRSLAEDSFVFRLASLIIC
ncbi:hypothetical protein GCM10022393_33110 [Aquimarina addita]|uniref:DUF2059 domain-containing protein n=1 Tax=Aquimarina addita TaxID=870485 RepID=A0ABP6UTD2_9FLAO